MVALRQETRPCAKSIYVRIEGIRGEYGSSTRSRRRKLTICIGARKTRGMRCWSSSGNIAGPLVSRVRKALDVYQEHLETRGNRAGHPNRPRTVEVTMDRLRKLFEPAGAIVTGELTAARMKELWAARAAG